MEPSPMYIIHFLIRQRKDDMDPTAQHPTKTRWNNIQRCLQRLSFSRKAMLNLFSALRNLP
jgi:hypothetical protein